MTLTATQLHRSVQLIEVKPGLKFPLAALKEILPDVEITLFFARLYKLDAVELTRLLRLVHNSLDVVQALTADGGCHSMELQDYVLDVLDETYYELLEQGAISFSEDAPTKGEILPELWESLKVDIAKSIQEVADKLKDVVGAMPGKEGEMVFRSLLTVNAKRPVLGDYKAHIHHAPQRPNLVVLDVSGSMSESTIRRIIDDVISLSYLANAHLAIVSDTSTHWGPGEYDSEVVLDACEFSGTHYETLAALFDQDWGVVVTIADYDSSPAAKNAIARCRGHIEQLLDISLVPHPTYLGEVLGQRANEVRPLMVAEYYLV